MRSSGCLNLIILIKKNIITSLPPTARARFPPLPGVSTALLLPIAEEQRQSNSSEDHKKELKKISGPALDLQYFKKLGRFLEEIAPPVMHGSLEKGMFQFLSTMKKQALSTSLGSTDCGNPHEQQPVMLWDV